MRSDEIIVGLDHTASARAGLRWAARQARTTGVPLRAVHVVSPTAMPGGVTRRPDASARTDAAAVFDTVHPADDWVLTVLEGQPGPLLVDESAYASLLVIGVQDHHGYGRLLAGSVSHHCLAHARCPVVAVPAGSSVGTDDDADVAPGMAEARRSS